MFSNRYWSKESKISMTSKDGGKSDMKSETSESWVQVLNPPLILTVLLEESLAFFLLLK